MRDVDGLRVRIHVAAGYSHRLEPRDDLLERLRVPGAGDPHVRGRARDRLAAVRDDEEGDADAARCVVGGSRDQRNRLTR